MPVLHTPQAGRALARGAALPRIEGTRLSQCLLGCDWHELGLRMHGLIGELYPICRSITGDGFRQTLSRLREHIEIDVHEVPTGTQVFDWTVPREWNITDAW